MVSSKQEIIRIIQGDGPEDLEQHPHGLLADSLAEHHGPRHRLLQALLLRGHYHRQPHCHAGAHYYVSCPIYTDQYNANPGKQVHQRVDVFAKDVLREDGRCLAPFHPSYPVSRGLLQNKANLKTSITRQNFSYLTYKINLVLPINLYRCSYRPTLSTCAARSKTRRR